MCIVCDLVKANRSSGMVHELTAFLAGQINAEKFDGHGAQFAKNAEIDVPDNAADLIYLGGVFAGLHKSAEMMGDTIKMHLNTLLAARKSMRLLKALEITPIMMTALEPLLEQLQRVARDEAGTYTEKLIQTAKEVGIRASLVDGSESIDGVTDEEFIMISERILGTLDHSEFGGGGFLAKLVHSGDKTALGKGQVKEFAESHQRIMARLEDVLAFRVDKPNYKAALKASNDA